MDNNLFIKNILILIFCIILIHLFLNDFLSSIKCTKNLKENFKNNNNIIIYFFYADWCGHCKDYKPHFNQFKKKLSNDPNVKFIEINADDTSVDKTLQDKFNIEGYPTTVIVKNNDIDNHVKLVGKQTVSELFSNVYNTEYFENNTDLEDHNLENNTEYFENNNTNLETHYDINKSAENITVYNFNSTSCKHSIAFQPIWNQFSDILKNNTTITAVDIKCDEDDNINLCNRLNIVTVPSIVIAINNKSNLYEGPRTVDGIIHELNLNYLNNHNQIDTNMVLNNHNQIDTNMVLNNHNQIDTNMVLNNKIKIYNFNVKWCKFSVLFEPEWNTFVNSLKLNDNIEAINVKCDDNQNEQLCKKFNIDRYPSIIIEKNNEIILYREERTAKHIRKYLNLH